MKKYKKRMREELRELIKKTRKLNKFIYDYNGEYGKLKEEDKMLLVAQLNAMYTYQTILEIRLER